MNDINSKSLNILEFRQFKGDHKIVSGDFEWMAGLRAHKMSPSYGNYKEPKFYNEDLQKYQNKIKNTSDDILSHPVNLAACEQLIKTYSSNQSNVSFGFNLRNNKNNGWRNSPLPPSQSPFDQNLPPITKVNIEQVEKMKNLIVHPKIKKLEVIIY